jgi:hypothetical protein
MRNFRLIVRLVVGSLFLTGPLLIAPANVLAMNPGTDRKLVALRLMVISLLGLMMIAFALLSEYSTRRLEAWEQEEKPVTGFSFAKLR